MDCIHQLIDCAVRVCCELDQIGYNRRQRSFSPIDPVLKIGLLSRATRDIYFLGYSCHPVALGRLSSVSADWPGAVIREMENRGHHAVFFQGFLGDIDPTTNLNRWGSATAKDFDIYGRLVASRAEKAKQYGQKQEDIEFASLESRIAFPLVVPSTREEIVEEKKTLVEANPNWPDAERFYSAWLQEALQYHAERVKDPYYRNVPLQAVRIGEMKIIGIPGEVFCEYGTWLSSKFPTLFPIGLAGGDIGYMPTREAYERKGDYACYQVAKFYDDVLFPFSEEIEQVLLEACEQLLLKLD